MAFLLANRPILKAAILYSLPALFIGFILRAVLTYYYPYAYWSKDSFSFMDFSQSLFLDGKIFFNEKRRYTYPLFLTFAWFIPLPLLKVLPVVQHLIGLTNVVVMGWVCLRTLYCGKILIIPVTILLAVHGNLIAYEHTILAEFLTFTLVTFSLAGWVKWRSGFTPQRQRNNVSVGLHHNTSDLWWHLIPFALLLLLKPSMRFLLPGWIFALALTGAWRTFRPAHYISMAVVIFLCLFTMGEESQGWRLLLTTAFPGLRVEGSRHPELVAQAQPLIDAARANLRAYHITDKEIKLLTEKPALFPKYPAWAALDGKKNQAKRHAIYRSLILESIRNDPLLIPTISSLRLLTSSSRNYVYKFSKIEFLEAFDTRSRQVFLDRYKQKDRLFQRLYGVQSDQILQNPEKYLSAFVRGSDPSVSALVAFLEFTCQTTKLVSSTYDRELNSIRVQIEPQLCFLIAGILLLGLQKNYRAYIAPTFLSVLGCLFLTYCIGSTNPRFYAPFVPVQILVMALPVDTLLCFFLRNRPSVQNLYELMQIPSNKSDGGGNFKLQSLNPQYVKPNRNLRKQ